MQCLVSKDYLDGGGTTTRTTTTICLVFWVLKQGLNEMNVMKCYTMIGGYVCLCLQLISVIINDPNQLNKFWMPCSSINQKGM
jgi:hypothetical protein